MIVGFCQVYTGLGNWYQIRNPGFGVETAAHPFDENFDAVPGRDKPSNQSFQTFKWALGNLDALSRFQPVIDLHNFSRARSDPHFTDKLIGQKRKTIAKLNKTADTWTLPDSPMKDSVIKASKKVRWKHGLDEPDWSPFRMLSKTHPGTENLYFGDLPQTVGRDVFPFGLGPQTEPRDEWLLARDFRSG
jgi:hypothetical protein